MNDNYKLWDQSLCKWFEQCFCWVKNRPRAINYEAEIMDEEKANERKSEG